MSEALTAIKAVVARGAWHVSNHAFEKLEKRGILASEVVAGLERSIVVEDYPDAHHGPSVLVLFPARDSRPVHAIWGLPRENPDIAVLITVYRPEPQQWSDDFIQRLPT